MKDDKYKPPPWIIQLWGQAFVEDVKEKLARAAYAIGDFVGLILVVAFVALLLTAPLWLLAAGALAARCGWELGR